MYREESTGLVSFFVGGGSASSMVSSSSEAPSNILSYIKIAPLKKFILHA